MSEVSGFMPTCKEIERGELHFSISSERIRHTSSVPWVVISSGNLLLNVVCFPYAKARSELFADRGTNVGPPIQDFWELGKTTFTSYPYGASVASQSCSYIYQ